MARDNPHMVPMKTSTIFKSRWMALVWAAGIIWFAYDTANSQPQASTNATANSEQASDADDAPVTSDEQNKIAQDLQNRF
jgi:hypothetical protein